MWECKTPPGALRWKDLPASESPQREVTQRVRNHRIPSRPHLQGDPAPLRLRHSARDLTDGGGLVLLRRLWDRLRRLWAGGSTGGRPGWVVTTGPR